ncbi:MAG TPA: transposase [Ktedonobacteraceae bacterium]|nr:transposase [Ktedonobacteraceae bacterium]
MTIHKNFQYRLYPTKKQEALLNQTLAECRWLYNHLLEKRKTAYEQEGKSLTCYEQINTFPILKAERPSLKSVHSQVLQNVAVRIDLAFKAFFRRCKAGEKPGYPRFKGYGRYDSFCYPQSGFSLTHDERVTLSKIGSVKMVYHRPIRGKVKTCTIHKSSTGKWYVTFSVECEPERLEPLDTQVGIDVGLNSFASLSTGEEIANPRFFRKEEKALAQVQRKHSKLAKGTPERRKHRKVVARVHERIKFRRENFTHQESRQIVDRFGVICVEDLTVNRMVHNHCLAKSIVDASWSAFFAQLFAKAEEAGRTAIKVNPAYTSQTCSVCGHRQKMPLSERIFKCPCCHAQLARDLNAAYNIRALGLQSLGLSVEAPAFQAWGVVTSVKGFSNSECVLSGHH